ncbi:MAG: HD domain-containing phosphohydrolase [Candidatus Limnocylindria bacterium]
MGREATRRDPEAETAVGRDPTMSRPGTRDSSLGARAPARTPGLASGRMMDSVHPISEAPGDIAANQGQGRPLADPRSAEPHVRLAEVVSSLSLATDLAGGLPIEHGLRRALLAVWLGEELGLAAEELSDVYYVALLGTVGCSIEGTLLAEVSHDELAVLSDGATIDPGSTREMIGWVLRNFGADEPPLRRIGILVSAVRAGATPFQIVCRDVALQVGEMLDIGPTVRQALGQCHERWDGAGGPKRLKGEEIRLPARVFNVAHHADLFNRMGGVEAAVAVMRRGRGRVYDPDLADRFCQLAPQLMSRLESEPTWDTVLSAEPGPPRWLTPDELDTVGVAFANFADIRSPHTVGHSLGVAKLAQAAARGLGLSDTEATAVHRAGLLHDLGRGGVPAAVWNKASPLTAPEWERVKTHPSLTEWLLARSTALGHLGTLAGVHHERLDGSGYRGVPASFQPVAAQILSVADAYQTKTEPRPYRSALTRDAAAEEINRDARQGRFDAEVVQAVLAGAGHGAISERSERPAGLSEREIEVLRLVIHGLSNRQMAEALFLSPKTVGHHIQHIYDKVGVSTRVGGNALCAPARPRPGGRVTPRSGTARRSQPRLLIRHE